MSNPYTDPTWLGTPFVARPAVAVPADFATPDILAAAEAVAAAEAAMDAATDAFYDLQSAESAYRAEQCGWVEQGENGKAPTAVSDDVWRTRFSRVDKAGREATSAHKRAVKDYDRTVQADAAAVAEAVAPTLRDAADALERAEAVRTAARARVTGLAAMLAVLTRTDPGFATRTEGQAHDPVSHRRLDMRDPALVTALIVRDARALAQAGER